MRLVFLVLLGGTAATLWLDYSELRDNARLEPGFTGPAILPSVERPELDPTAPQFRPNERVTIPSERLESPLLVELRPGGILALTGTIDPGSSLRFAAEIAARGEYVETILLTSPGGSVEDAMSMGRLIREMALTVSVETGSVCASSCPLVLAGGTERIAESGAVIGVHQVFAAGEHLPGAAQAMSDAQVTTARISRYLEEMGIGPGLWLNALETPPNRLYYLTEDELIETGLATEIASVS